MKTHVYSISSSSLRKQTVIAIMFNLPYLQLDNIINLVSKAYTANSVHDLTRFNYKPANELVMHQLTVITPTSCIWINDDDVAKPIRLSNYKLWATNGRWIIKIVQKTMDVLWTILNAYIGILLILINVKLHASSDANLSVFGLKMVWNQSLNLLLQTCCACIAAQKSSFKNAQRPNCRFFHYLCVNTNHNRLKKSVPWTKWERARSTVFL